jgi:hypothetical protein
MDQKITKKLKKSMGENKIKINHILSSFLERPPTAQLALASCSWGALYRR